MCRTESLSCTAEVSTTLQINSTSLKKKKKKKMRLVICVGCCLGVACIKGKLDKIIPSGSL